MNLVNFTLGTIISLLFVMITAYGAYKKDRNWFTLGLCFYHTIPIIGESLLYAENNDLMHLTIIMLFLTLVIITLPIGIKYGADNPAAMAMGQKNGFAVIVANLCHGYLILSELIHHIPIHFGIFHLCMASIVLYAIVRSYTTPNSRWITLVI